LCPATGAETDNLRKLVAGFSKDVAGLPAEALVETGLFETWWKL